MALPNGTLADVVKNIGELSIISDTMNIAQLNAMYSGEERLTFFAPANPAFDKIGRENLAQLLRPESQAQLRQILRYHSVEGALSRTDLMRLVEVNQGRADIQTLQGGTIAVHLAGDDMIITDSRGNQASIAVTDLDASNGVIHVLDSVLVP